MVNNRHIQIKSMMILSITLVFLAGFKAMVGFYAKSPSLLSDAVQSSGDLVVAIASFIGLMIATRPPDKNFPYGYYKIENLITFFISIGLFITAGSLIIQSIKRFTDPQELNYPFLAMTAAVSSIFIQLILGLYLMKIANETNSPTIEANGKDKLSDTIISASVFISLILTYFKVLYAESVVTILVSLLIIRVAFSILKDALYSILDVTNKTLQEEVGAVIQKTEGVKGYSKLRLRKTGAYYIGDCEIVVEEAIDVGKAHKILETVIDNVKESFPVIISFVVEIEPTKKKERIVVIPVEEFKGLEGTKIHQDLKSSPTLLILKINMENKTVLKKDEIKNPYYEKTAKGLFDLAKLIERRKIDTLIVKDVGEVGFNQIKAEKVEIFQTCTEKGLCKDQDVDNILNKLYEGTLIELEEPSLKNSI